MTRLRTASVGVLLLLLVGAGAAATRDSREVEWRGSVERVTALRETAQVGPPRAYRFVRRPRLYYSEKVVHGVRRLHYKVFVRLDRHVPRTKAGPRASLTIDGRNDIVLSILRVTRDVPCYSIDTTIDAGMRDAPSSVPEAGEPVPIDLYVRGDRTASDAVLPRRRSSSELGNGDKERRLLRELGCVPATKQRPALRGAIAAIAGSRLPGRFNVVVRTDRRLPRDRGGDVVANVTLGEAGSDASPVPYGHPDRHCYVVTVSDEFDAPSLRRVAAGDQVTVQAKIGRARLRRTVRLVGPGPGDVLAARRALGCGRRR